MVGAFWLNWVSPANRFQAASLVYDGWMAKRVYRDWRFRIGSSIVGIKDFVIVLLVKYCDALELYRRIQSSSQIMLMNPLK